jgi:hypothetical protein
MFKELFLSGGFVFLLLGIMAQWKEPCVTQESVLAAIFSSLQLARFFVHLKKLTRSTICFHGSVVLVSVSADLDATKTWRRQNKTFYVHARLVTVCFWLPTSA